MKLSKSKIIEGIVLVAGIYAIMFSIEDQSLRNTLVGIYSVCVVIFHFLRIYFKIKKTK